MCGKCISFRFPLTTNDMSFNNDCDDYNSDSKIWKSSSFKTKQNLNILLHSSLNKIITLYAFINEFLELKLKRKIVAIACCFDTN